MNGKNITTGTIHTMGRENMQACGARVTQRVELEPTTEAVTCVRCSKAAAKPATAPKPAKSPAKSSGPATWLVRNATGETVTFRTTKREALAAADRIGGSVARG